MTKLDLHPPTSQAQNCSRNCGLNVRFACMLRVDRAWCLQLIKFQVTENGMKYVRISFCSSPINATRYEYRWKKRILTQGKCPSNCFSLAWVCLQSLPQHAPYMAAVLLFLSNPHTPLLVRTSDSTRPRRMRSRPRKLFILQWCSRSRCERYNFRSLTNSGIRIEIVPTLQQTII
jgi:hypothetical protein